MTFSHSSGALDTSSASTLSSMRLPVLRRWLWQLTQYVVTSSRAGVCAVAVVARDAAVAFDWSAPTVAEIVAASAIDAPAMITKNRFRGPRIAYSGRHRFCAMHG